MAITEIYVDPSINADSGTGTIGDPFGDLEYAIEQTTFDTTNGTRVNIKAGTDEVVAVNNAVSTAMADTGTTVAWVPSVTAPAIFQGYTTAAGDGGIGGISGGGVNAVFFNHNYVHIKDLHIHNCGSQIPIRMATGCSVINCEVDNTTGRGIYITASGYIAHCYVHDVSGSAIDAVSTVIENCVVTNIGTKTCSNAISAGIGCFVKNNIISVDSTSNGILLTAANCTIEYNSIYSDGGSGSGVFLSDTNSFNYAIANNLIEGFSASGGYGIEIVGAGLTVAKYGANSIYDCDTVDTNPTVMSDGLISIADNETLIASPFTDADNLNMSPVDTGTVKEGAELQTFWAV